MGTSTDRTSGRGGAWTPLKHAATSLMRGVETDHPDRARAGARRVAARHVAALGGADAATAGARAGRDGTRRLGGLLAAIGQADLATALESVGLGELVGLGRFEVVDELVTLIAGDGADLDGSAARDAACEVLDELFGNAQSFDELTSAAASTVTADTVDAILRSFLVHYVYNRVPVIAEKLSRVVDLEAINRADEMMREIIRDVVDISLPANPFDIDWAGTEGRELAADAVATTYATLENLDIT